MDFIDPLKFPTGSINIIAPNDGWFCTIPFLWSIRDTSKFICRSILYVTGPLIKVLGATHLVTCYLSYRLPLVLGMKCTWTILVFECYVPGHSEQWCMAKSMQVPKLAWVPSLKLLETVSTPMVLTCLRLVIKHVYSCYLILVENRQDVILYESCTNLWMWSLKKWGNKYEPTKRISAKKECHGAPVLFYDAC